jgi:hypothetical protein
VDGKAPPRDWKQPLVWLVAAIFVVGIAVGVFVAKARSSVVTGVPSPPSAARAAGERADMHAGSAANTPAAPPPRRARRGYGSRRAAARSRRPEAP